MRDPVIVNETGSTYERSSIEEWFRRGHHVDPLSHVKLTSRELIPNRALQAACCAYLSEQQSSESTINDLKLNEGMTLLHIAAKENSINSIKELLFIGANVNLKLENGETPLHVAAQRNSIDVAKELIAHGADINLQNKNKESPLYVAAKTNSIDVAKELIAYGANVDHQNEHGASPLYVAVEKNSIGVAKELIVNGANINLQTKNKWTPLHIGSTYGHVAIVKILLECGASKRIRNIERKVASDVVCSMFSTGPYAQSIAQELKWLVR